MNTHLIEFKNVSYSYEDNAADEDLVLHGLDFTVDNGEFVVILGRNGSGKSTVAKLSNGIFLPSSGNVYVDGLDSSDERNEYEIRKKVGVVFQNPDNQIVASIVEEDVAFGPENLGVEPFEIRRRVDDAMKATGIYDYRLHETHRLSGGQKQRVAISGILAMQPACIVLDEPTAMLDPSGRKEVLSTVHRLNKENGTAVVLITHYMNEAVDADRVIVIDGGRIVASGTPRDIFSDFGLLSSCGLDVPDVTRLAFMLKQKGAELRDTVLTEKEFTEDFCGLLAAKGDK